MKTPPPASALVLVCLLAVAALFALLPSIALAWPGIMLEVPDADTVVVAPSGDRKTPVRVRLYGIDAPELGQPTGPEARDWLRERLPAGTPVEVIPYSQDRYGRTIGLIQIDVSGSTGKTTVSGSTGKTTVSGSTGKTTVNGEIVAAGLAWVYWPYCKERFCRQWGKAEKAARADRRGLWQDEKPERPDKWRKRNQRK